ncbi:dephospho-CoA kinase [Mesorhizobium sp. Z1-4]|uniref:dephospho-CoA kinase n=1 Tax=Mesorhizobium sp. Z1-4 TaxID=2448478 RepID=UPI000FD92684|nr:dephospho-CoA kinase [Mesorhizobium sp. Z1-4]
MIILGLTGSIGMGKSTTAKMFVDEGIPVHDSDATVHRLYAGKAARLIEAEFPGTVSNGVVDRRRLAAAVLDDQEKLRRLGEIVHPLVRAEQDAFVARHRNAGAELVVLDIPLLFEVGATSRVDDILVVTASPEIQKARVMSRPGMTAEKFAAILANQVPDREKRRNADFVIDTGAGMEAARTAVRKLIQTLKARDRSG